MHSYLKSIGFSKIQAQDEIENLIAKSIAESEICSEFRKDDGHLAVEFTKFTSANTGIKVIGEEDTKGNFHFSHYFPFCNSSTVTHEESVYVDKRLENEAYSGACEDSRLGISLIFYIQNCIDYLEKYKSERYLEEAEICFSGLALDGKIILPNMQTVEKPLALSEAKTKKTLLEEAKKGNPEAIQNLTMKDIDLYASVMQRIRKEDVLSVVRSSIIPTGSEADLYRVMGTITDMKHEFNTETGEGIWIFELDANGIMINVSINENDLTGRPQIGMRFRGSLWMQGSLS